MELSDLRGLGPARLSRFRAMGIDSLRDLLYFFPLRYEDHVHLTPVADAWEGEKMVRGVVRDRPKIAYFKGMSRVTALLQEETGSLPLCWFNEPWMAQQLPLNREIMLYGRIQIKNGRRSLLNPRVVEQPGWIPVYRTIKGFPAKSFHQLMHEALSCAEQVCPETLPRSFRERYELAGLDQALQNVHFPESLEALREARRRLAFE